MLAIYSSVVGFISYQEPRLRGRSSANKVEYAKRFSLKKLILALKLYKLYKMNIFQMLKETRHMLSVEYNKRKECFFTFMTEKN